FLKSIMRADQQILNVFTKSDKLTQKELSNIKKEYPNSIFISNLKNRGIDTLNEKIFTTIFKVNS
ncbi:MAG: YihA family ribosome biogenesis GTP-binding protein, partial [Campylobacterales bacterium]|nr:YihA family ribosome biogenesis GTP-binding protein [Campylobacterales bacterium]